jgi:hypothetical protein
MYAETGMQNEILRYCSAVGDNWFWQKLVEERNDESIRLNSRILK